ncbi:hypothetical protein R3W88_017218 [Solanum pinnatisectum]|uniref:Uncharacterized protein n=1 Tax=Solanum pinnatisectum TaxID=50273 RepID=A0AAV9L2M8_9SOLN|nr:hypothetical protein R3W88_017218 [Solanum pinnatisectum]
MNSSTTYPGDPSLVPSRKSERYIALVKFMRSKDLVMRTLINDVELLILASTLFVFDDILSPHIILYCMLSYYVDAPMNWCCEECDIGKGIMSLSSGLENVHYEGSNTVQPKKHGKFPDGHRINWEKEGFLASLELKILLDEYLFEIFKRLSSGLREKCWVNLYRGVTNVRLKAIAQGCPTLKELSLSNRITDKSLLGIAKNCLHLNSLLMNDCSYIENESLKIMGQYCLNLKLVGLKNCPFIGDQGILDLFYSAGHILTRVKLEELNINDISLDIISHDGTAVTHLSLANLQGVEERGFWVLGNNYRLQKLEALHITSVLCL